MKERKAFHEIYLTKEEKTPYYASTIEGLYGFILRSLFKLFFTRIKPLPHESKKIRDLALKGLVVYKDRITLDGELSECHPVHDKPKDHLAP